MPKKNSSWGTSSKVVEARERKADKKRQESEAKEKAVQDAYWKDDCKQEQRKKKKKEDEQRKKEENLARKQEAKKLLEEEESKLTSKAATKTAAPAKKVTRIEIEKKKDLERQRLLELEKLKNDKKDKIAENPIMEEENPNQAMAEMLKKEGGIEARNVEDAISVLNIESNGKVDIHPEKRMKAAYKEFEEINLPRLKEENPNLRLSQLRQMLRKEWQKSPDNPFNQP